MKKIIVAFDGLKFSKSAKDYAIAIAKENSAHLIAVFLDDFTYHSYKVYDLIRDEGRDFEARQKVLDKKDARTRVEATAIFESACRDAGIQYTIHHDRSIALQELLHESIYADLLVVDRSETLTHYNERIPTRFIRDVLTDVQCPALVVPRLYKPVEKAILLYDGEPSSVHAIKMFSYTLPSFKKRPAEVLSVNSLKRTLHMPDNKLMREFLKRHYPNAMVTVLKGAPEVEIIKHLKNQVASPVVVLGAYRRGIVSRWFRESMADVLMKEFKFPLFIAHNK